MNNIFNILTNPGDKLELFISPTGRKVAKLIKDSVKVSVVQYSSGRIVKTISYLPGSKIGAKLLDLLS